MDDLDRLVERLREWSTWYEHRKKDARSLSQQVAFNNTMIDGCLELMAMLVGQLLAVRGRQLDGQVLWTPRDLRVGLTEDERRRVDDRIG